MNWNSANSDRLIKAILSAETPDALRNLLDDLLTENELEQCIQRLKCVHMLLLSTPYEFIRQETGLGSATIARISKKLINKKGGFRETMRKLHPRGVR